MRVVFLGKVGYFFLGEFFLFLGKEDIINIRESFLGWGEGCFGLWGRTQLGTGAPPLQTGQHSGELTANSD